MRSSRLPPAAHPSLARKRTDSKTAPVFRGGFAVLSPAPFIQTRRLLHMRTAPSESGGGRPGALRRADWGKMDVAAPTGQPGAR